MLEITITHKLNDADEVAELFRRRLIALEFGRKGYEDLHMIQRLGWDRALGLGVVDVKTEQIESADLIARRAPGLSRLTPPPCWPLPSGAIGM